MWSQHIIRAVFTPLDTKPSQRTSVSMPFRRCGQISLKMVFSQRTLSYSEKTTQEGSSPSTCTQDPVSWQLHSHYAVLAQAGRLNKTCTVCPFCCFGSGVSRKTMLKHPACPTSTVKPANSTPTRAANGVTPSCEVLSPYQIDKGDELPHRSRRR